MIQYLNFDYKFIFVFLTLHWHHMSLGVGWDQSTNTSSCFGYFCNAEKGKYYCLKWTVHFLVFEILWFWWIFAIARGILTQKKKTAMESNMLTRKDGHHQSGLVLFYFNFDNRYQLLWISKAYWYMLMSIFMPYLFSNAFLTIFNAYLCFYTP